MTSRAFDVEVPVAAGDRLAVLLAPGATIGSRPGVEDAAALRWDGALTGRPVPQDEATRIDAELMLRADIEAGARAEPPPTLTGAQAAGAPAGEVVEQTVVQVTPGAGARVAIVRLPDEVVVDVIDGERTARMTIVGAAPQGTLRELELTCGFRRGFCVHWQNDAGTSGVYHAYRLDREGRRITSIG
jgi:hypothetical protein